ncbi:hypothetical protein POX_b02453 [Penicillium oxalicum]|uniref:hypothetical protein n=1 Tax=Penicillium oxalicum TaxID=69781 RepID=UPI0020B7830B|nr:hypothetical protein POX_b02453 [Penicillium oxalicum]KAI2792416.1 hypothetical protein POX_b02453 [Penicillium oxalicum]
MNVFGRSGMVPSGKSAQFRQVVSSTHEVQYINHAIAGIAPCQAWIAQTLTSSQAGESDRGSSERSRRS